MGKCRISRVPAIGLVLSESKGRTVAGKDVKLRSLGRMTGLQGMLKAFAWGRGWRWVVSRREFQVAWEAGELGGRDKLKKRDKGLS